MARDAIDELVDWQLGNEDKGDVMSPEVVATLDRYRSDDPFWDDSIV